MNSFISFFKKSPALIGTLVVVLGLELFLGFAPFMDYLDPTGVYYTTLKRNIAESKNDYDIIMLGDSRSLSIYGKQGTPTDPSFFNFSLPAAGTRYLTHFMDKYLVNNKTPQIVVFALDPEQFKASQLLAFHMDPTIWQIFKHRLLNLFSVWENWTQYEGKERYFIFKESLPNAIPTYRHREGLEKMLTGMKAKDLLNGDFPYYKSNKRLEALTYETQGQVNLGTYLEIPPGITQEMIQKTIDASIHHLESTAVSLESLDHFLEYAKTKGFRVVLLEIPHAEGMATTRFYTEVRNGFRERARTQDHVELLEFPQHSYTLDHYAEGIHFNGLGEKRANQEFDTYIWPKLREMAKLP